MSDAHSDKAVNADKSDRLASSPDELVKDLDVKLTEEEQKNVTGGADGGGAAKDPISVHHFGLEIQ